MRFRKIPQTRAEARANVLRLVLIAMVLEFSVVTDCFGTWAALSYMVWAWWLPIQRWEKLDGR